MSKIIDLPASQTSIEITQPGGPEVLQATSRDMPVPTDSQVLIEVAASGVNRPDVFQRMGFYPPPPGVTDIPGLEGNKTGFKRRLGDKSTLLDKPTHLQKLLRSRTPNVQRVS